MLVLRTRHTDAEISEMRERNKEIMKGISFSDEWLSKQPPVSEKRKKYLTKIARSAWKKCFLSDNECEKLKKELGGNIDFDNPRRPESFCAWSWLYLPDEVKRATMYEI